MTPTEKIESYRTELSDILNVMNIPSERKILTHHNLMWLKRNIGILNNENSKFHRAVALIYLLLINENI